VSRTYKDKKEYRKRGKRRRSSADGYKVSDRTIATRRKEDEADYDLFLRKNGEKLKAVESYEFERDCADYEELCLEEEWYMRILAGKKF
jgi:hypothetical protein